MGAGKMSVNISKTWFIRIGLIRDRLLIIILLFFSSTVALSDIRSPSDVLYFLNVADSNAGVFSGGFSISDINKVLVKFESSFKVGDIDTFISLFEENVKTEDGNNQEVLKKEYSDLFRNTDSRSIKFKNAVWKEDKNGIIWGDIDFMLNIRNRIDKKSNKFSGAMRIYFKKRNKMLVIDGFFYAYDEATTQKNTRGTVRP